MWEQKITDQLLIDSYFKSELLNLDYKFISLLKEEIEKRKLPIENREAAH